MKIINLFLAASILGVAGVGSAFAATQGSEGATSSGTTDVSVIIPKLVKITGLNDIGSTGYVGSGGFDQNDPLCIYSNMDTSSGLYTVKVTAGTNASASAAAGFNVGKSSGLVTDQIPFAVLWNDASSTGGSAVTHNTNSLHHNGFSNTPDCGGGNNANIQVTMDNADMLAVHPGTYSNTLTVLITPE